MFSTWKTENANSVVPLKRTRACVAFRVSPWQQSLLKAMAAVFLSHSASLKRFTAARLPQTLSPVRMWKTPLYSHHLTHSPESIRGWHVFLGLFKLCAAWHEVAQDINTEKHTNTELFIHSLLSLAEIFSASFAVNVLQTASPCLWVLLFSNTISLH